MRNRMIQGAFRYGPLGSPGKPQWDRIEYAGRKLQLYKETGNCEYLVDVANLMLLEFVEGYHPNKHFETDSTEDKKCFIKTVYLEDQLLELQEREE